MGPTRTITIVFLALGLVAGSGCSDGRLRNDDRPSVIVLSIDTLNRSELRSFDPRAEGLPNLDGMARQSVIFARAFSTASWTLPAHASLMTGLYPDRHSATQRQQKIRPDLQTLAGALSDLGYESVAFTDGGYVSYKYGFARGFRRYDDWYDEDWLGDAVDRIPRRGKPNPSRGASLFDRAIAWLEERDPQSPPLFLFLHTFSVHDYFLVRPWAVADAPSPYDDPPAPYYGECIKGVRICSDEDWSRMQELYHAELAHLDRGVGRLLEALQQAGLRDSAYILVLSDHGEGFDHARQRIHHGGRLDRDVVQIPMFLHGPDVTAGIIDQPASLVDVMPTILDLVGATPPRDRDGTSLAEFARDGGGTAGNRALFAMEYYYRWENGKRVEASSVRRDPFSVAAIQFPYWYIDETERSTQHLYDIAEDPDQQHESLSNEVRSRLRARVVSRLELDLSTAPMFPDPALVEELRSLGYVE